MSTPLDSSNFASSSIARSSDGEVQGEQGEEAADRTEHARKRQKRAAANTFPPLNLDITNQTFDGYKLSSEHIQSTQHKLAHPFITCEYATHDSLLPSSASFVEYEFAFKRNQMIQHNNINIYIDRNGMYSVPTATDAQKTLFAFSKQDSGTYLSIAASNGYIAITRDAGHLTVFNEQFHVIFDEVVCNGANVLLQAITYHSPSLQLLLTSHSPVTIPTQVITPPHHRGIGASDQTPMHGPSDSIQFVPAQESTKDVSSGERKETSEMKVNSASFNRSMTSKTAAQHITTYQLTHLTLTSHANVWTLQPGIKLHSCMNEVVHDSTYASPLTAWFTREYLFVVSKANYTVDADAQTKRLEQLRHEKQIQLQQDRELKRAKKAELDEADGTEEEEIIEKPDAEDEETDEMLPASNDPIISLFTYTGELLEERTLSFHEVLFTFPADNHGVATIGLKHHDDLNIYHVSVEGSKMKFEHISTFPGMGYISAGKKHKKYVCTDSACRFVVIAEYSGLFHFYEHPALTAHTAAQYLLQFPNENIEQPEDTLYGMTVAANGQVTILRKDEVVTASIPK